MRKLLALFIIFLVSSSVALATNMFPDNIQSEPAVIRTNSREVTNYNVALRNKLESQYDKKYRTCDDNGCVYNAPLGSYGKEVLRPYALQKKPDDYKIISK